MRVPHGAKTLIGLVKNEWQLDPEKNISGIFLSEN